SLSSDVGSTTYSWAATPSGSLSGHSNQTGFAGTTISQTISNSGTAPGSVSYSVTGTANGCTSASASETIAVNPLPNGSISGSTDICANDPTTLTFNLSEGVGPFNVQYSDGTTTFSLNGINDGHTMTVNPSVTTTYSLVSLTDANSCNRS